jgi:hypothetical protein
MLNHWYLLPPAKQPQYVFLQVGENQYSSMCLTDPKSWKGSLKIGRNGGNDQLDDCLFTGKPGR